MHTPGHDNLPYPATRSPVFGERVVATSQPLAAQAGLAAMQAGGNAVDAALAAAITLTVVEPVSNGIGGDAFAMIWDGAQLHGFNGSGRSPGAWSRQRFADRNVMPATGWETVTTPGAVDTWAQVSGRFGKLAFEDLFTAAIRYARDGFHVPPIIAETWRDNAQRLGGYEDFAQTFLPGGRAPRAGERFACPDQARTLQAIARSRGEAFYRGELAERIVRCAREAGGALALDDLAGHRGEWVEPIAQDYGDVRVHELPPNGQGLAALIALGVLDRFDLRGYEMDSPDSVHLQLEAMKLAFIDAQCHFGDPDTMRTSPAALLDADRLAQLAARIDMQRAMTPPTPVTSDHGTVYLCAADRDGMMVSFIQSNYQGFGSGIVIPGTGISMQNRGAGFTLQHGHPNEVAGGKRPYHTIIPGFATRDGAPLLAFGVMGGHMQPQGHVQMITRMLDYQQNPQAALDAPRWHVRPDFTVALEQGTPITTIEALARRGHAIITGPMSLFGGGQIIQRLDEDGRNTYCAGSDPRKDGHAIAQ